MFENEFNLSFNLHKAYTDIGISVDDRQKMACIYDLSQEELTAALERFACENRQNAETLEKEFGPLAVNSQKEFRIAYLGDSITSYRISYRCILGELIGERPNVSVHDFSISGLKVSDLFTAYYPGICDFAPNIAVMMIGTNDMRITDDEYAYTHTPIEHFYRDYAYLVDKLTRARCTVIAVTLPPFCMEKMNVALDGWKILYQQKTAAEYDAAICEIAQKYNAVLVDMREVYPQYDAAQITIEDGLHLNSHGHYLLTREILPKLAPLLA